MGRAEGVVEVVVTEHAATDMVRIPRRPPLRYFGGKWRLAPWILSHLPPHICYVEPFCGGASLLLRKRRSEIEVINDLDGEIVNFFQVLRGSPDELIRAVELTPFSRLEHARAHEPCPAEDTVERARRLYIRSWQGRGGPRTKWKSGWRFQRELNRGKKAVEDWSDTGHLWEIAERLKPVQIECADYLEVLARYDAPGTVFVCDPPYVSSTRSARWATSAYAHEMTEAGHRAFAAAVASLKGMVLVCGYDSELYGELFAGWERVEKRTQTDAATSATEVLWLSPTASKTLGGKLF